MSDSAERIPGGYILLARKALDSELMNKPPLYLKLWVWMIGKANWRDRDKLKRGQFVTTIAEMQEAMSFQVGWRKVTPTKDEIRSAYEAFTKTTMITTRKTTRGMVVTILNYGLYQDSKNYEGHKEAHDEDTPKPTDSPQDTEEGLRRNNLKPSSPEALRLSGVLADMILKNNPGNTKLNNGKREATVARWAVDIDKLIRIDGKTAGEIERVIHWCQADSFWMTNILSGAKLREKWDQLTVKMQGNGKDKTAESDRYGMFAGVA